VLVFVLDNSLTHNTK